MVDLEGSSQEMSKGIRGNNIQRKNLPKAFAFSKKILGFIWNVDVLFVQLKIIMKNKFLAILRESLF